ncbi:MAG TPA: ABC transporter permease [Armatimonadetes bacterium]|nr:ABC transporter permease [Armatimonadota bacterium]
MERVVRRREEIVGRQVMLPWSDAVKISWRNIMVRLGRSLITAAGIFLGVAFFATVVTQGQIMEAVAKSPHIGSGLFATDPTAKARQTWLILMSFVVAGVGVTNAMLMSVTERYREIGTMKCLGALDGFIVRLFLIEAGFMGLAGGVTGSLAGFVVAFLFSLARSAVRATRFWAYMDWGALLIWVGIGIGAGVVLALVAAIPPAWRAAKLPPAAALRVEI